MLHGLAVTTLDNDRHVATEIIYADESMVITIVDKKTGQRMQIGTNYTEWCKGGMKVHDAYHVLEKEFKKNDGE